MYKKRQIFLFHPEKYYKRLKKNPWKDTFNKDTGNYELESNFLVFLYQVDHLYLTDRFFLLDRFRFFQVDTLFIYY